MAAQQPMRARPMQERALRTRERILEAAAHAFAEGGYEGTSLNDLIAASGLTKGAFYHHFSSKEELALATFRHKQGQLLERVREEAGEGAHALEELGTALRARVRVLRDDPSLGAVLRLGAELGATAGPESESEFASFHEVSIGYFAGLVERGQAEVIVRPELDARATGEAIFAAIVGVDRVSRLLSGRADLEERTEQLLDLLTNGLAKGG